MKSGRSNNGTLRVVIFPTNVWEYDVLDYFPFADLEGGAGEPSSDDDK